MTEPSPTPAPLTPRQGRIVLALTLLVLLFSGLRFDGPSRGYWDTYITVPAMFMTGQAVDLHRIDGTPRYEYELKGRIPDDTYDPSPGSFGVASSDQRIGTGILFAAPFALGGLSAFRWGYAACWAAIFLLSLLSLRRLLGGFGVPLAASLVLVLNPFSLYLDRLNGNVFGLAVMLLLWFLMSGRKPTWWLVGAVYGLCGGIRNEAIVFGPMFLAFLWVRSDGFGRFAARLGAFTGAAFATILPVLAWNRFAYGQALIHPSQVSHLEGFRPTFPHRFFGAEFDFNGLLNVPFHDELIRTPHWAFPTFVTWPLVTVTSLGLGLAATALIGLWVLRRRRPFEWAMLVFWYGIIALLFAFQENWEELKQTFMALHLFPVVAFVGAGLAWVVEGVRERSTWIAVAACAGALALALLGIRQWQVPVDERWYERFPHAAVNDSGLAELPMELRKDWQYFYTAETEAEIEAERRWMTRVRPWPVMYRPPHVPDGEDLSRLWAEPRQRELRTLAVWSYIYE